jgi:O-antigen/teichoic acid export membrane protein
MRIKSIGSALAGRVLGNSLWSFAAFAAYSLAQFVSAKLYIGYLGLAQYGMLVLLWSITAPLGLLNIGFGQATVKYMAEKMARGDKTSASVYLRATLLFNVGIGVLGAALLIGAGPWLVSHVFKLLPAQQPMMERAVHWLALTWLTTQISGTLVGVPTALQQFRVVSLGTTLFATANIALGIVVLAGGGGLVDVMQWRFYWSILTVAYWVWTVRQLLPGISIWPKYDATAFRQSFNYGIWQTAAIGGSLVANQADKYLLGIYISAEAVGLFSVASTIFVAMYSAVSKLADALFPAISDLHGRDEKHRLVNVVLRAGWLLSLLMVAVQGALYTCAGDLLWVYVGIASHSATAQVLRLCALTAMISAPAIVLQQFLLGTAATRWIAIMACLSGVFNLGIGLLLVPRFGILGAAWGDLMAILLTRPLLHWMVWRREMAGQVGAWDFFRRLYGAAMVGVPIALLLGLARGLLPPVEGWFGVALLYGGAMLLMFTGIFLAEWLTPGGRVRLQDLQVLARTLRLKLLRRTEAVES